MPGQSKATSAACASSVSDLRRDAELDRRDVEVMPQQLRDVLATLAQRRHADADDVEPVQQVLAKLPARHARLEILVRRGDHAHVDPTGSCPPTR